MSAMETDEDILIEEVDKSQIPEYELQQFEETQPLRIEDVLTKSNDAENEEILITKFINGEVDFPEYYTRITADEEDESVELTDNDITVFEKELNQSRREAMRGNFQGPSTSRGGKSRRRPALTVTLQGLMGQANLCFARGQNDMAEKICMEIIRENPLAAEPFLTLAQIYETKDPEKCLQYSTLAAHLEPSNRDLWIRLAEVYVERNNLQQAKSLYAKGIKHNPKDVELRLRKIHVLEAMKDESAVLFCNYRLLQIIPVEQGAFCLKTAKNVAQQFHKMQRFEYARNAMACAYNLAGNLFSTEDINMYLELLIMNEDYTAVLNVLKKHTNVDIALEQDGKEIIVVACMIPDDMLPDFRVKLCITLIHLKAYHLLDYLISNVQQFIPGQSGVDWYVDIAEELIKEQKYAEVIQLLQPLIDSIQFTPPPYVCLCYADCQRLLNNTELAIEYYYKVADLAPNCFDARLTLSALLKQQGKHQEAIKILEQDVERDSIDPRLLYERCLMLKGVGDMEQYLDVGYLVILRNSIKITTRQEMLTALAAGRVRSTFIKNIREGRIEGDNNDQPEFIQNDGNLSFDDEFRLLKDLLQTAYNLKKFGIMQKLAFTSLISPFFQSKRTELEKIMVYTCLFNNDPTLAFEYFRTAILRNLRNSSYWNLYSLILQKGDDMRYRRFIKRLFSRVPDIHNLQVFGANYCLYSGSYKYALNEYMPLLKKINDPLVALGISVAMNQLSGQKNVLKKPTASAHAIAFMKKYSDLRWDTLTEQEINYNLGRLHHNIGLLHLAVHYYEKALHASDTDLVKKHPEILCLKREIAFNLHLIYKTNGNNEMARKYIYEYLVV